MVGAPTMRLVYWKDFLLRKWVASPTKVSPCSENGYSTSYLGKKG